MLNKMGSKMIEVQQVLNEWVIQDIMRRNAEYIRLAIEEWDKGAEGDFIIFVNKYVTALWEAMARLN